MKIKKEDELWQYVPLNRRDGSGVGDPTPAKVVEVVDYKDGLPPVEFVDISKHPDVGFRVFKLDTTNLRTWDATPIDGGNVEELHERMNAMVESTKPERSDLDMVCEVMLKLGVPLTYPITQIKLNGKPAYSVGEDALLLVCLAPGITPEDVEAMADYAPGKLVIARDSFADDTAMANAYYILRDRKIELKLV